MSAYVTAMAVLSYALRAIIYTKQCHVSIPGLSSKHTQFSRKTTDFHQLETSGSRLAHTLATGGARRPPAAGG